MITFKTAKQFLWKTWMTRQVGVPMPTVFLVGPPGIGKSAVATEVARDMTELLRLKKEPDALLEILDLTSRAPEDIGGLPFRDPSGVTRYSPQDWAWRLSQPGAKGVLVFDDLPAASAATAAAVRQVVLDRRVNGLNLSPDVLIIVTGNRREDMSGAMTLPAHFRNAVCTLELEAQFEPWCEWFLSNGGNMTIASFLQWKPGLFSTLPKDADKIGRFATPRSWTLLSRSLEAAQEAGCTSDVVGGFVGSGVSVEFMAFMAVTQNLPKIVDIFNDPKGAIPNPAEVLNSPDKLISVTSGLGFYTTSEVRRIEKDLPYTVSVHRTPEAQAVMSKFIKSVAWVARSEAEHVASALTAYTTAGGPYDLIRLFNQGQKDEDVTRVLQIIRSAVN